MTLYILFPCWRKFSVCVCLPLIQYPGLTTNCRDGIGTRISAARRCLHYILPATLVCLRAPIVRIPPLHGRGRAHSIALAKHCCSWLKRNWGVQRLMRCWNWWKHLSGPIAPLLLIQPDRQDGRRNLWWEIFLYLIHTQSSSWFGVEWGLQRADDECETVIQLASRQLN